MEEDLKPLSEDRYANIRKQTRRSLLFGAVPCVSLGPFMFLMGLFVFHDAWNEPDKFWKETETTPELLISLLTLAFCAVFILHPIVYIFCLVASFYERSDKQPRDTRWITYTVYTNLIAAITAFGAMMLINFILVCLA